MSALEFDHCACLWDCPQV